MCELNTQYIDNSLPAFNEDIDFSTTSEIIASLENILSKLIDQPYTWGKYIYEYLFERYFSQQATHYSNIEKSTYHELIEKLFSEHNLKNRGSLSSTTRLNQLMPLFEKPSTEISREVVYLFAYGLGMDLEELSLLIQKALLQPVVNLRNYKEVIYYWCFCHDCGNKPEKIQELLNFYSELPTETGLASNEIKSKTTQTLLEKFENSIQTEIQLKEYLRKLKNSEPKKNSLSLRKLFSQNFKDIHRINLDEENQTSETEMTDLIALEKQDSNYSHPISCQEVIKQLDAQRKKYYKENTEHLLNPDITKKLFKDMSWENVTPTKRAKTLQKLIDGSQTISRNEFLLSVFLNVCAPLTDDEYTDGASEVLVSNQYLVDDFNDYIKERYFDSMAEFDETLMDFGMLPTYSRNPFDLFLSICLMHEKPYEYLMANWYQAIS